MPTVLVADKLEDEGIQKLRDAGLDVVVRPGLKGDDLAAALRSADGVIVRSGTRITADVLTEPGRLKAIVRAGVGVDTIDVPAATRKGIIVMNTPGGNTLSTAEHTLALIFALVRQLPPAERSLRGGQWERSKFMGTQLAGKTLGIIGLGRIGREVAKRALSMDMKVVGFDPVLSPDRITQWGIEPATDIPAVLTRADILTVHVPFTEATRNMIGAAELALLRPGSRVVNCARGGIINEAALVEALKSGHLAGAALDVFEQEPPPSDHPLLHLPNVVVTPHLGASTREAQRSVALEAADLLIGFLHHGQIQAAVNMVALDRTELAELRPYANIAYRLGLLHAQMHPGSVRRVELHYRGDLAHKNTRLLTAAFTVGLLETRLAEYVNPVNAEVLARERGIEIVEEKSPTRGDFSTVIRADVHTEAGRQSAAATLFGQQYLRLVQLGPYLLDGYLDGILLIFTHRDMPGLIGFIGTVFGAHHVNIAQMAVGRQQPGGEAIAVLNLDSLPPEAALAELRSSAKIHSLHVVKLPAIGELPAWLE